MKKGLTVYGDAGELARGAARLFFESFEKAVAEHGFFSVVLSGGSTPARLYSLLASEYHDKADWKKVHFFWGDERCVPPDSAESNYNTARLNLLSKIDVPPQNIHRMKGELPPSAAARDYEEELISFFGLKGLNPPPFDLVLLGMGIDGHTLSLFPGTKGLVEKERLVVANHVEKLAAWRVTLTFRAIESAVTTAFLVSGADKAAVLEDVLGGGDYPAARVKGREVVWLADSEAAGL